MKYTRAFVFIFFVKFSNLSLEQEQAEDDTRLKMKGHIEVVDVDDNGNRKVISSEDIRIK